MAIDELCTEGATTDVAMATSDEERPAAAMEELSASKIDSAIDESEESLLMVAKHEMVVKAALLTESSTQIDEVGPSEAEVP